MKLAAIVLAHTQPQLLRILLRQLEHPSIQVYLHLDSGADAAPFRAALSGLGRAPVWLPRHRSRWGGIEVVEATLDGLRRGVADGCDYFVLLSGQDLALESAGALVARFAELPNTSFIASFPLPDTRWRYEGRLRTDFYTFTVLGRRETCVPRGEPANFSAKGRVLNELLLLRSSVLPQRRFPSCAAPFGGSQWWNLSREAARHVLRFIGEHPEYHAYHRFTLLPDEMYFQSILIGAGYAEDNEVVNDASRYMVWAEGESHPRVLALPDLEGMRSSGLPFARKFDLRVAPEVVHELAGGER